MHTQFNVMLLMLLEVASTEHHCDGFPNIDGDAAVERWTVYLVQGLLSLYVLTNESGGIVVAKFDTSLRHDAILWMHHHAVHMFLEINVVRALCEES